MTRKSMYHGGIVFQDDRQVSIDQFCRIVTATLEDYGQRVERQSVRDSNTAVVVTSLYMVELTMNARRSADKTEQRPLDAQCQRLEISMVPADGRYEDRDISELMMVVMLYRMVDICTAESIEWMDPGTVLTVEQFLSAFTNVSPHRVRGCQSRQTPAERFAPVDETAAHLDDHYDIHAKAAEEARVLSEEETLAMAFRSEDPLDEEYPTDVERAQSDIRRLAVWGMTGMVALLSAPVAASLAAVNLARGEDLRLNTQVLSFTGLIAVLSSTGILAQIMQNLPI